MNKENLTFNQYITELSKSSKSIDNENLNLLISHLQNAIKESKKIIIMGNGGSAAKSIHIAGDYLKTFSLLGFKPRFSTPFDNTCFLTAASNDVDYTEAFRIYLDTMIENNSIIIFLSGSGNSINLIKCFNSSSLKSSKGLLTWSITAFKGGKISKLTKNFLHIPTLNMEIAEDIQLIIFHYIKTKLVEIFYRNKECRKILNSDKYFKRTILDQIS